MNPLSFFDRIESLEIMVILFFQEEIPRKKQPVFSSHGDKMGTFVSSNPGPNGAVIKTRRNMNPEANPPFSSLCNPQNLVVGFLRPSLAHREKVKKTDLPLVCPIQRLQGEGLPHVSPGNLVRIRGCDLAVTPFLPIEDAAETTTGVNPGHAAPVDGARPRNQRCRMAVPDIPIIANGGISFSLSGLFRSYCHLFLIPNFHSMGQGPFCSPLFGFIHLGEWVPHFPEPFENERPSPCHRSFRFFSNGQTLFYQQKGNKKIRPSPNSFVINPVFLMKISCTLSVAKCTRPARPPSTLGHFRPDALPCSPEANFSSSGPARGPRRQRPCM